MASLHYTSVGNLLDNNYNPNSNIEPNNFNDIYQGSNISYTLSLQSNGFQYLFVLDNGSGPQTLFGGPFTSQGAVFADFSDNQAAVDLSGSIRGDILRSGSGSDILRGGDGNDTLEGGAGTNTLDGGTGVNTVSYEHYQGIFPGFPIGVTVDLSNGTATDGAFPIFAPSFTDTISNVQNIHGSSFVDTLTGDSANNVIEGGAGGDNISGGGGSDTASYEHSASGVAVNLATGAASGGDAAGDTLSGIANLLGSAFKDTLTGDANANMLSGGGGNDVLDGAVGADTLIGGAGNDAYVLRVGDDQDTIIEQAGGGTDTVRSAVSITSLADNVERIQLVGKANLDATGNDLKNMITGNTADNHINGGGGSDVLTGFGGGDTFVFDTAPGATNVDRITDFNLNDASHHDTIALDQTVFASVGFNQDGSLKDGEFAVIDKTHKPNAEAHLFYNADKGALYYDPDGYYGHNATAVQVAVFDGIPTITSDDVHALIS